MGSVSRDGLTVHRCRFFEWQPSAVVAMALDDSRQFLAVCREDGEIEVWNRAENLLVQKRFAGRGQNAAFCVAWVGEDLVTGGLHGRLALYISSRTTPIFETDSGGGAVWAVATSRAEQGVYCACDDGTLRFFSVDRALQVDEPIAFRRSFPPQNARVLCCAVSPDGSLVVTGNAASSVRVFDTATHTLRMQCVVDTLGQKDCCVWSVAFLAHGAQVCSGSALGKVQVWDTETGNAIQSVQAHKGDVTCLAEGSDGSFWSGGLDGRVCLFRAGGPRAWALRTYARSHTHDVRALATDNDVMLSGGVDTQVCMHVEATFGRQNPVKVYPFPHRSCVSVSARTRRVLCEFRDRVELWAIGSADDSAHDSPRLLLTIRSDSRYGNITCSALSPHGSYVLVATPVAVRLFAIRTSGGRDGADRVKAVPVKLSRAAAALADVECAAFAPGDEALAVGAASGAVRIIGLPGADIVATFGGPEGSDRSYRASVADPSSSRCVWGRPIATDEDEDSDSDEDDADVLSDAPGSSASESDGDSDAGSSSARATGRGEQTAVKRSRRGGRAAAFAAAVAMAPVCAIGFSADGRWCAVGTVANWIKLYSMDSMQHAGTLDVPHAQLTALQFHPSEPSVLLVSCTDNALYAFDVEKQARTSWSSRNSELMPMHMRKRTENALGVVVSAERPESVFLWSHTFLCRVTMDKPLKDLSINRQKKRKRAGEQEEEEGVAETGELRVVTKYHPVLGAAFLGASELLLIERPWLHVLEQLPDAIPTRTFGL